MLRGGWFKGGCNGGWRGVGLFRGVSNLTFFFGLWFWVGECGLSGCEVGLGRFFVLGVLMWRGVFFEGDEGIDCVTHGCVLSWYINLFIIWVMTGSSSPVRVYRS